MILLTGANGMLGSHFPDAGFHKTDIDSLDVRDIGQVRRTVEKVKPDAVFHLAAETDVDLCEKEPDHAYRTNALGTHNVALVCQEKDLPLLYVSTAGVFDGTKPDPYTEFDAPNPGNIYGDSKWQGEKIVQNLLRRCFIVRAGWMVGGGPKLDKKFVGKILRLIEEGKKEIPVVDDKFGSLTYAKHLARQLPRIFETKAYGLYHWTNKGSASRYQVAQEIARIRKSAVTLTPVCSAKFPLPAPRVRSEAMRNYKLELMGLDDAKPWQDALAEYIGEWKGA